MQYTALCHNPNRRWEQHVKTDDIITSLWRTLMGRRCYPNKRRQLLITALIAFVCRNARGVFPCDAWTPLAHLCNKHIYLRVSVNEEHWLIFSIDSLIIDRGKQCAPGRSFDKSCIYTCCECVIEALHYTLSCIPTLTQTFI